MKNIDFRRTQITGGLWKIKQDMVRDVTAQAVYDRFRETHRFDALKCKWKEGEPNKPHIFWDSDVAKWIEGVSYLLESEDFPSLRAVIEEAIDDILENCDENGYFNSHFLVTRRDERFCHRNDHELYCAGHLIEAAVAYARATGERRFLEAMCRYADYIERVFKKEKSAKFATPGHPELELALIKLWEETGEERYLSLASHFIDEHGEKRYGEQNCFESFATDRHNQDEMPIRERTTVEGHAVRAMYLFSAAADLARILNDRELHLACERIFDNTVNQRMYITGGIGTEAFGEAFTIDYDLPNRTAYSETCAAIGLVYFASRMQRIRADVRYADCIERVLYNGFLSGISMDGRAFFYVNPLEIDPYFNDVDTSTKQKKKYPITQRREVFSCSCCPPNIVRFIPSVADHLYTYNDETLYVHQYMQSETRCENMTIKQITDYPNTGGIRILCNTDGRRLALRIPSWCKNFTVDQPYTMEGGYAVLASDIREVCLHLEMPVVAVRANRRVHANAGRVAIMRGPVVYCAEGVDNGRDLSSIRIDIRAAFEERASEFLLPTLHAKAYTVRESESLYTIAGDDLIEIPLTLIPYYAFANRGETEMCVWLLEK